jgi:hypothetical protein
MFQPPEQMQADGPLPVLVKLPDRADQRRWTVLIRWILLIPLGIVLFFFTIGALVVMVIGWFGALFTGRAPTFMRDFIARWLNLSLNFSAYGLLLTDRYPPFEMYAPDYPAQIAIPGPTNLNRAAVLFRIILAFPVSIVGGVLQYGIVVLSFFLWLITLVTGRLPQAAHDAVSASLRFQTRLSAYLYMVVPTYPSGLFGDPDAPSATSLRLATESASMQPPEPEEPSVAPALPPSWRLVVGQGGRRLLVVIIVLGAAAYVGQIVYQVQLQSSNNSLNSEINSINQTFVSYTSQTRACASSTDRVSCVEGTAGTLAIQLNAFADQITGYSAPFVSQSAFDKTASDARHCADIFSQLANAGPTAADYLRVANAADLQGSITQLSNDINAL